MKQFFKFMFASMLGFMLFFFLLFLLLAGIVGGIVASTDSKLVDVKEHTILTINLNYPISERTSNNPFEQFDFLNFELKKSLGLNDIISNIQKAKNDSKIDGIYLELGICPNDYATLEEIRDELIEFKKSKKFVVAFGELVDEHSYYVASVSDKIYIHPSGQLVMNGMSSQVLYLKNMFEKIGVKPELIRHGKFKAAGETLISDKMSDENRAQIQSYVGSIFNTFIENVASSRKKTKEEIWAIINELQIQHPEDAKNLGIIDGLKYYDEVESELTKQTSRVENDKALFVSMGKYKNVQDKNISTSDNKIAIIYCTGEIVSGKGDEKTMGSENIAEAIKKARTDNSYKAIVLRINSPGGSAMASDVIWREVSLAKKAKPVVVSMGGVAASGGYYIACQADAIVAEANTITGSIGVFGLILNAKELLNQKLGINVETVKFGQFSDLGFPDKELTETERSIIQKGVDRIYNDFVSKVADGRKLSKEFVDSIAQGRVWAAADAKKIGLVDEIGGLNKAVAIAAEKAKLKDYRKINLPEEEDVIKNLIGGFDENISTYFAKKQLGEQYQYYDQIKKLLKYEGMLMRMNFDVKID